MASKFQYHKRTYDEAKKQINESDSGTRDGFLSADLQLFKPAEGTNKVRIMPPGWAKPDHYGYRIFIHYGIGPNNDAYICPYHTVNPITGEHKLRCPICEEKNRIADSDDEYAKKLRPAPRVLVYLLKRGGKGSKPVLEAWAMPASLDKAIMQQSLDDETLEVLPVDCPEEGYDLDVIREGTGLTTKYTIKVARRASEVEDFEEEWWPKISGKKALPENLIFYDYDYLSTVFSGGVQASSSKKSGKKSKKEIDISKLDIDDLLAMDETGLLEVIHAMGSEIDPDDFSDLDDLAEEIAAELKDMFKPKKSSKAKAKPEPEEEEEEEEEEPEPPKKAAKPPLKKKEPEPEEEEEEEPEEEEEEEPEPPKKASRPPLNIRPKKEPEPEEEEEEEEEEEPEPPKAERNKARLSGLRNRDKG